MRLFGQTRHQCSPVFNSVILYAYEVDVRLRTQQLVLKVFLKTCVDGKRNYQRGHTRRYANNRNHSDHANHCLPPLGTEISRGNKELKSHAALSVHTRRFMPMSSEMAMGPRARGPCTRDSAAQISFPIRVPQSRPSAEMFRAR
jgi:hypothetical protein